MKVAGKDKKIWKNYVNDQVANPLKYFKPTNLSELLEIIKDAGTNNYKVKAIGSGHSSSDIALTRDYMVDTHGLNRVLDRNQLDLNENGKALGDDLLFIECGIVLHDLIKELEKKGKGLCNMGGYDGQTIAGVVSTSTHGSGITLETVSAYVEAIILIAEDGKIWQIERTKGISSSPANLGNFKVDYFRQCDDIFNAAIVSMGCMGVIYAFAYKVRDMYNLQECRSFENWGKVKLDLQSGILQKYRHYEVLVNPYVQKKGKFKGDYNCLVTKREATTKKPYFLWRRHRQLFPELMLTIIPDFITDAVMRFLLNTFPRITPSFLKTETSTLSDSDYVDKYYKVLDIGKANNLSAFAMELSFPGDRYIDAVDKIIDIVNKSASAGEQFLMSAFSLRFVKTNDIFLSMQTKHRYAPINPGEYVCMIEFPTLSGIIGGVELLDRIEFAMYQSDTGAIPHWGQVNHLGGTGLSSIGKLYPKFTDWLKVYQMLSPNGMFENDFTKRCGIS